MLLNVDRVAERLEELGYPAIQVRGLADSGWFLDNKQYLRTDCLDTVTCAPTEAIRRGIRCPGGGGLSQMPDSHTEDLGQGGGRGAGAWAGGPMAASLMGTLCPRYWNGMVPERCRRQFKEGEEWNCFFGYKVYPTLRCEWGGLGPGLQGTGAGGRGGCPGFLHFLKVQPGIQLPEAGPRPLPCLGAGPQSHVSLPGTVRILPLSPLGPEQTRTGLPVRVCCGAVWGLGCPSAASHAGQSPCPMQSEFLGVRPRLWR